MKMLELINKIHNYDNAVILGKLPDNSIDGIITDPPYEIGFMGNKWDSSGIAYNVERWREHLRVLKPGGYLLAFSSSRTYHRMAVAIEDAGFEMRDKISNWYEQSRDLLLFFESLNSTQQDAFLRIFENDFPSLDWLYGSGFPKSKMQLKPAHEPICVARKAAAKHSHLNIDAGRIPVDWNVDPARRKNGKKPSQTLNCYGKDTRTEVWHQNQKGRVPSNVILDETTAEILDEQTGTLLPGGGNRVCKKHDNSRSEEKVFGKGFSGSGFTTPNYNDIGGASRFFYVAKASPAERAGITHPTVKPISLISQLIKLYTNENDIVFDGYGGSGTTAIVCRRENRRFILCESNPQNFIEAEARLNREPNRLF